jgi:hypothetical protein
MDRLPATIETETLEFVKRKIASRVHVARALLEEAEIRQVMDMATEQLVMELSTYALADHLQTLEKRVVFTFPATPWDHLKDRLAAWGFKHWRERIGPMLTPRALLANWCTWYVTRHPIRESAKAMHVSFVEEAIFPDARLRIPRDQHVLRVARMAHYPDELLGDEGLRANQRLDVTIDDDRGMSPPE